jgi:4-diphosphocytidyl-2-C-methyl-D-erythritol kinase
MPRLQATAPAKVNLTLRVLRRRADGAHDLTSLVAFAAFGDRVAFTPGPKLELAVSGPTAAAAGAHPNNLVLAAARAGAERVEGLKLGRFELDKRLPVGAGFGGGSADAGAALRLIAEANDLEVSDPRLFEAARATGADVPVCLEAKARIMSGIGDQLSAPIKLPRLDAVLVYPSIPVATATVFARYQAVIGGRRETPYGVKEIPKGRAKLLEFIGQEGNDLSRAARSVAPVIAAAEEALDENGAELVRMSGSGSGVWGIFEDEDEAEQAATDIRSEHPGWWTVATKLG